MKNFILFLLTILSLISYAQNSGDVTKNFGAFPGFNGTVNVTKQQTDGKILIGGDFTIYEGYTENRIIRLNTDGTKDTSFNSGTGFNDTVWGIEQQADGKILIVGKFTTYKGNTENRIVRLNTDGTKDATFNTGTGFNDNVITIEQQTDGKILVGGSFTTYNENTENKIILLNSDGTRDTSFLIGTRFNFTVIAIEKQADGKTLVGGNFTSYNGRTENRIIRLNADGTKDATFNNVTGFNNAVNKIKLQSDGKILVGGDFTSYKGVTENRIIRLNADGTKDTSFNTGTGFDNNVFAIEQQTDGKILLSGYFSTYNGNTEYRIIRLNTDGTKDATFNTGTGSSGLIQSLEQQADGKFLAGGVFTTFNGNAENKIIRLNSDGTKDTSFNKGTGFNGSVWLIKQQADGKILVGGGFTAYNGKTENKIIRFNTDGTKDATFNTGKGFNGTITTIEQQTDGKILIGGNFTSYDGNSKNSIVRLNTDGTIDPTLTTGSGFNGSGVYALKLQVDGKILVGGDFTTYKGVTENRIVRLNTNGTKDTTFNTGTGFSNVVSALEQEADGKILVGGSFTTYNEGYENRIIRLNTDGTKDTTFNTGTGFNENVFTIILQTNGKILVGGYFSTYNGNTENRIIRLNTDGTKDISFNAGTGFDVGIRAMEQQIDDKILVGGDFTTFNGNTENRIISLNTDGTKNTSFNAGTGFKNTVLAIEQLSNGKILIGGSFYTYKDSNESSFLIALHTEQSLGTASFDNQNILIVYPNPVNDILNIQSNNFTKINAVKIYDLHGKLITKGINETINVSKLSKGVYIIKILTEKGEFTQRFIKE